MNVNETCNATWWPGVGSLSSHLPRRDNQVKSQSQTCQRREGGGSLFMISSTLPPLISDTQLTEPGQVGGCLRDAWIP